MFNIFKSRDQKEVIPIIAAVVIGVVAVVGVLVVGASLTPNPNPSIPTQAEIVAIKQVYQDVPVEVKMEIEKYHNMTNDGLCWGRDNAEFWEGNITGWSDMQKIADGLMDVAAEADSIKLAHPELARDIQKAVDLFDKAIAENNFKYLVQGHRILHDLDYWALNYDAGEISWTNYWGVKETMECNYWGVTETVEAMN